MPSIWGRATAIQQFAGRGPSIRVLIFFSQNGLSGYKDNIIAGRRKACLRYHARSCAAPMHHGIASCTRFVRKRGLLRPPRHRAKPARDALLPCHISHHAHIMMNSPASREPYRDTCSDHVLPESQLTATLPPRQTNDLDRARKASTTASTRRQS